MLTDLLTGDAGGAVGSQGVLAQARGQPELTGQVWWWPRQAHVAPFGSCGGQDPSVAPEFKVQSTATSSQGNSVCIIIMRM